MSDETTQEVQTTEVTPAAGQEQQAVPGQAPVEAEVATETPTVEPAPIPELVVNQSGASTIEDLIAATPATPFYMGQEVKHRLGLFDADGAEECELADGTTVFVPKSILGE